MMIFQKLAKNDDFFKIWQKLINFQKLAKMMIFQNLKKIDDFSKFDKN